MNEVVNGKPLGCKLEEWGIGESKLVSTMDHAQQVHSMMLTMLDYMKCMPQLTTSVEEIKQCLLSAAIGKEHVPLSVVEKLLKIGALIVFGLVGVIVFLLTGSKFGALPSLH